MYNCLLKLWCFGSIVFTFTFVSSMYGTSSNFFMWDLHYITLSVQKSASVLLKYMIFLLFTMVFLDKKHYEVVVYSDDF